MIDLDYKVREYEYKYLIPGNPIDVYQQLQYLFISSTEFGEWAYSEGRCEDYYWPPTVANKAIDFTRLRFDTAYVNSGLLTVKKQDKSNSIDRFELEAPIYHTSPVALVDLVIKIVGAEHRGIIQKTYTLFKDRCSETVLSLERVSGFEDGIILEIEAASKSSLYLFNGLLLQVLNSMEYRLVDWSMYNKFINKGSSVYTGLQNGNYVPQRRTHGSQTGLQ